MGAEPFALAVVNCDDAPRRFDTGDSPFGAEQQFAATAEGETEDGQMLLLEVTRITVDEEPFDEVRLTLGDRLEPTRSWEAVSGFAGPSPNQLTLEVDLPRVEADAWFTPREGGDEVEGPVVDGAVDLRCP